MPRVQLPNGEWRSVSLGDFERGYSLGHIVGGPAYAMHGLGAPVLVPQPYPEPVPLRRLNGLGNYNHGHGNAPVLVQELNGLGVFNGVVSALTPTSVVGGVALGAAAGLALAWFLWK